MPKDIYIKIKLKSDVTVKDLQKAVAALKKIGIVSETAHLVDKPEWVTETTTED
jgi:hypothetical protein